MINEDKPSIYIKTADIPQLLLDQRDIRFSESMVRQWINREPSDHPLIPDQRGRAGQAHLFRPQTVLNWYDEDRARALVERIKLKIARRRRLGLPVLGDERHG